MTSCCSLAGVITGLGWAVMFVSCVALGRFLSLLCVLSVAVVKPICAFCCAPLYTDTPSLLLCECAIETRGRVDVNCE